MSNVLIVVEAQPDGSLRKATLNAITAGKQITAKTGGELHAVVLAKDAGALANVVKEYGVKVVHAGSAAHLSQFTADVVAPAVAELATAIKAEYVGAAATQAGRDVMPRIAARLKAAMASEILGVTADLQFT